MDSMLIPHIWDSITETLSFKGLLNCILVNRQWHDAFIPTLWSDVVTVWSHLEERIFGRSIIQEPYS